ncbi:MAG: lipoate protein ligase C-terminal domain-containing protein [Candidatus Aenigmatarchaeota archaeon]
MEHIDYKVPGGKLIRLGVEVRDDTIEKVEIHGDFFVHPESGLEKIESSLKGMEVNKVEEKIEKLLEREELKIVGFEPKDLQEAIERAKS